MIDVVFFLLVFFMMASLSMATYRGLPVNLPQAATGRDAIPDGATITVTRDGQTFLDKEPVALPALAARLRGMAAARPGFAVFVNADDAVAHGRVVAVLDEVRGAGVGRLAIAIRPTTPATAR
jgi:biopolymer transport protein ExbD